MSYWSQYYSNISFTVTPSAGGCCESLFITSLGHTGVVLAEVMGQYVYHKTDSSGYYIYLGPNNFYLYIDPATTGLPRHSNRRWMVSQFKCNIIIQPSTLNLEYLWSSNYFQANIFITDRNWLYTTYMHNHWLYTT